jgi:hypothetical protein
MEKESAIHKRKCYFSAAAAAACACAAELGSGACEHGSGRSDACPSIRVYFCLCAISYALASRGTHTYCFLFHSPRSLGVTGSSVRFICTIACMTPPGIFYPSLDPGPGTTVRTVPILGILEIVGR